MTLLVNTSTYK